MTESNSIHIFKPIILEENYLSNINIDFISFKYIHETSGNSFVENYFYFTEIEFMNHL